MYAIRAFCGVQTASSVRWGHAVNSIAALNRHIAAAKPKPKAEHKPNPTGAVTATATAAATTEADADADAIDMIEVDLCVRPSAPQQCVVSHDPHTADAADSFNDWLTALFAHNAAATAHGCTGGWRRMGLKLDIKQPQAVPLALAALHSAWQQSEAAGAAAAAATADEKGAGATTAAGATMPAAAGAAARPPQSATAPLLPVWFNADVLPGPNGGTPLHDADAFVGACVRAFPDAVARGVVWSLGWTTGAPTADARPLLQTLNANGAADAAADTKHGATAAAGSGSATASEPVTAYSAAHVQAMRTFCAARKLGAVTLPVRACFVRAAWTTVWLPLLRAHPHWSLTVWTAAADADVGVWSRAWFAAIAAEWPNQVFLDLPLSPAELLARGSKPTPAAAAAH